MVSMIAGMAGNGDMVTDKLTGKKRGDRSSPSFFYSLVFLLVLSAVLTSCYSIRPSRGGAQISDKKERKINPEDIALPAGYKIEVVAKDLSFPTSVTFDEQNDLYYIEAGYSYGEVWKEPALVKISKDGSRSVIAKGAVNGPWTGVVYHDGFFYIAEGGEKEGGKILKISRAGEITALIEGLPSIGDHHTNGPAIHDGFIYFGQGTATNSAVVGEDNMDFGWLKRQPSFHDIPCEDVVLEGNNYSTDHVLTETAGDKAVTGAFVPFNTTVTPGQVIKGTVPCNGAVMRIPLTGGSPELVAWGFRNPFGLSFSPEGELFLTENGFDDRGSRPVWGAGDVFWKVEKGRWYGWPDYSAGKSIITDEEFKVPGREFVKPVLGKTPGEVPKPVSILGVHASANGFDFCRNESFGHKGEAFIAEFGDMAPSVGKVLAPVGFRVIRVNPFDGRIEDFAANKGKKNGPATWLGKGGLERPVSARFDKTGQALYIVDFGILRVTDKGPEPMDNTGVIWKITRK